MPTTLGRVIMSSSVDTTTAILERGSEDHKLTLADLRRMAAAVAVAPHDLLVGNRSREPHDHLHVQLVALLHRDGATSITELAVRLQSTPEKVLDAVDAYNDDATHGLKIMRWHQDIGLVPDPAIESPQRPAAFNAPEAAHTDHLLWQVIDRASPGPSRRARPPVSRRWPERAS